MCTWSADEARRYLRAHGMREDQRTPSAWIAACHGASHACVDKILLAVRRIYAACGNAHHTYRFVWGVPLEPWNHGAHVRACRMDFDTYHRLVTRATVRSVRAWRDAIGGNVGDVFVHRLTIEDGWGRGNDSVPWQLLAHPANVRCTAPGETTRYRLDPNGLLRDALAWNREHGTVLIDASTCAANVDEIVPPMLRNAN